MAQPVSTRNTKISQAWWHEPVVPAIEEVEARELLEPRRERLQSAKIVPLDSSLGNTQQGFVPEQQNQTDKMVERFLQKNLRWKIRQTNINSIGTDISIPSTSSSTFTLRKKPANEI